MRFSYTLVSQRKRSSLRVLILEQGDVKVFAPHFLSKERIEFFLSKKSDWILKKQEEMKEKYERISKLYPSFESSQKRAKKAIVEKVKFWNDFYGFSYESISIKRHQTRWGSCSRQKRLNFNYKLLFVPEILLDYVVVHELCHLKEMNHSKKFWSLVALTVPDYKQRRILLKKY